MSCDRVRDHFTHGRGPTGADLQRHAESCATCAELLAGGGELGRALAGARAGLAGEPSTELAAAMRDSLAREHGAGAWLRSRSTPTRSLLAAAAGAAVVLAVFLAAARADWTVYPPARMLLAVTVHAVALAVVVRFGLRGLHVPPPPSWVPVVVVAAAAALPVVLAALPQAHAAHPASLEGAGDDFARRALACFLFGCALAVPVVVSMRLLDRSAHRAMPRALLAAAAAGLAGSLALQVHCPITHPSHLLAGHATVLLAVAAAYAAAHRLLRSRA